MIRIARIPHGHRYENDTEHSYQLAMVAWFLIDQDKLKLNKELCFMYALSHDLVEIYAGDTFAFDKAHGLSKHTRENDALMKITNRFKNFKSLTKIIESYEKRKDRESKFIYALDKLVTPIQVYLENGKLWKEHKVTFKTLMENKNPKIAISKHVEMYWHELADELSKNRTRLFPR